MAPKYDLGYLPSVDGSCLYRDDGTTVIVGVTGPTDVKTSKQLSSARIEVDFGSYGTLNQSGKRRMILLLLRKICESAVSVQLYPRTCITIIVKALSDNGRLMEACINATCLALLDAALPLKDIFCARTEVWPAENEPIAPTSASDDGDDRPTKCAMTFVFLEHSLQDVFSCFTDGSFTLDQLRVSLQNARTTCTETFRSFRSLLIEKYNLNPS
ncbi:unnamed protein product [Soboliphyme baturini]|uniref:RNase_PH domain-containing protein n=1 Tax=Soboliphyme baturini TaxID=241478 RepID=A0A183IMG5_9BILA|nr:unnamed protein product [Soboliphyme baturini]